MRNSHLSILDSDPFEKLSKLRYLDISHNNFERLNFSILSETLKRLEHFYAANSRIESFSQVIKHLGGKLQTLDLSGNFVVYLEASWFYALKDLSFLFLSDNKLQKIDLKFTSNALTNLHLQGNELNEVGNAVRSNFPFLFELDISDNRLTCEFVSLIENEF